MSRGGKHHQSSTVFATISPVNMSSSKDLGGPTMSGTQ